MDKEVFIEYLNRCEGGEVYVKIDNVLYEPAVQVVARNAVLLPYAGAPCPRTGSSRHKSTVTRKKPHRTRL